MSTLPDLTPLASLSTALSGLVAATAPAVVSVKSDRSLSSGFTWKPGLIVTADDALADDGEITVTAHDGTPVAATVMGRDPTTDIALLRIEKTEAAVIPIEGAHPPVGALAVAIGSRSGAPVAAFGMVAAAGPAWRSMRGGDIDARISLDLSLQKTSVGGLAVDTQGKAFGMTVFGPRRRVIVIPGSTIARVATVLESRGRIPRGYFGAALQPVRLEGEKGIGVMVMSVERDGPSAKAGLCQGDVIHTLDGAPIRGLVSLVRALGPASVGQTMRLGLSRSGEPRTVDVVIGERPAA